MAKHAQTIILPQEMVEEIAARLPVKSLMKFKCVSKSWLYMIESDRRFIDKHLRNSKNNPRRLSIVAGQYSGLMQLALLSYLNIAKSTQIDDEANNAGLVDAVGGGIVVGCCNGLLCILKPPESFFVWNPATRVAVELPNIGLKQEEKIDKWGFGYDQRSDAYKVFALVADREKARGLIYSTKRKSWRTMEGLPSWLLCGVGRYWGGRVHWFARDGRGVYYLDLENEVFRTIQIADGVCNGFYEKYERLQLICYNDNTKKRSFCVIEECGRVKELWTDTPTYWCEDLDPLCCYNGAFFFETLVSPNI